MMVQQENTDKITVDVGNEENIELSETFSEGTVTTGDESEASQPANGSDVDALEEQIGELTDQLQRLHAEFQNYMRRQEREAELNQKLAKKDLIVQLLDVLENLERALHSKDSGEGLEKGIEMVYQELHKILTSEGVHPIEALGKPFDPTYHEVMLTIKDDTQDDGTIVEEYQRGYLLHGKVIRYSKVKIAKGD